MVVIRLHLNSSSGQLSPTGIPPPSSQPTATEAPGAGGTLLAALRVSFYGLDVEGVQLPTADLRGAARAPGRTSRGEARGGGSVLVAFIGPAFLSPVGSFIVSGKKNKISWT